MRRPIRDLDRHLYFYRGSYYYRRKVPADLAELDKRSSPIKKSLHTDDLGAARKLRDNYEKIDNELWAALRSGFEENIAFARYEEARRLATQNSFTYLPVDQIVHSMPTTEILSRLQAASTNRTSASLAGAVLGVHEEPGIKISKVLELYISELCAVELRSKSPAQRGSWEKVKRRAVNNFIALCGDKAINDINRADALKLHGFWLQKITNPSVGKKALAPTSGNRDLGNMRVIYDTYMKYIGKKGFDNPFDGLSFADKKKKTRPPFSDDFIRDTIMSPTHLGRLNPEARAIMLAMIETGCRPSELCNIRPENIHLNDDIPFIVVKAVDDPENPRDIKTQSSERQIPLVGVALEVFKRFPKGFPKYHDKENSLSAVLMKHFRLNGMLETQSHKIYSIRHSFEDRMKNAGLDTELRMMLMGHTIDRPQYGEGGSLRWKADGLAKMAMPFDPSIVLPPKPVRG